LFLKLVFNLISPSQQERNKLKYLPKLKNKKVAIVTNASGIIGSKHLVDTLLMHKIKIVKIFGPEHGFRGTADAGEKVKVEKIH
jgi:uncharacterized protein YbbC (DUF1343 family)